MAFLIWLMLVLNTVTFAIMSILRKKFIFMSWEIKIFNLNKNLLIILDTWNISLGLLLVLNTLACIIKSMLKKIFVFIPWKIEIFSLNKNLLVNRKLRLKINIDAAIYNTYDLLDIWFFIITKKSINCFFDIVLKSFSILVRFILANAFLI